MKKLIMLLLVCSCSPAYMNGVKVKKYQRPDQKKYGIIFVFGIGLGEQFKKPSR